MVDIKKSGFKSDLGSEQKIEKSDRSGTSDLHARFIESVHESRLEGTVDEGRKIVAHVLQANFRDGKLEVTNTIVGFGFENPGSDIVDVRIFDTRGMRTVLRRLVPIILLCIISVAHEIV